MARSKRGPEKKQPTRPEEIPPGATTRALHEVPMPGSRPPPRDQSDLGDRHAAGTPAGGSEYGGLAGTNVDEGSPRNADLDRTLGTGDETEDEVKEDQAPYSGISGGAVGGSPAQGRSSGGRTHGGIAPGGVHRGDSTIGAKP